MKSLAFLVIVWKIKLTKGKKDWQLNISETFKRKEIKKMTMKPSIVQDPPKLTWIFFLALSKKHIKNVLHTLYIDWVNAE